MSTRDRLWRILEKAEILVAGILFFVMLVSCGLYIDMKMNGKTSSLPSMSENEKRILLRSDSSISVSYKDDLLEPVFVGIKNDEQMVCANIDRKARKSFENATHDIMYSLFSGTSHELSGSHTDYIQALKNSRRYMLVSFFDDIPAAAFLPCLSKEYEQTLSSSMLFDVKHLFILPDEDENVFGVCVSSDNDINLLYPDSDISFNRIPGTSYDINEGYSNFEYLDGELISPVISTSFNAPMYKTSPMALLYGKDKNSEWVAELLGTFSININLVKSYSSKNYTEINYVDELHEVYIDDSGKVVFRTSEGEGVGLEEFLGFVPDRSNGFSFSDKLFAVRTLVNRLSPASSLGEYSIVGIEYDEHSNTMGVYLKYFVDGAAYSRDAYDAAFEIAGNNLVYASFVSVVCAETQAKSLCIPQSLAASLFSGDTDSSPVYFSSLSAPLAEYGYARRVEWSKNAKRAGEEE